MALYNYHCSMATLEAVTDDYETGGNPNPGLDEFLRPFRLTAGEKRAMVELHFALRELCPTFPAPCDHGEFR